MKVSLVLVLCLGHLTLGANPNYSYHIKIDDAAHGNFQEKAESRKGPDAQGFYSVVEPNGALRTVEYTADDRGFNPIVTYSYGHPGGASHSSVFSSGYAPAFLSDKRVQIVDKYVGAPPALNIQPFALPAPSFGVSSAPSAHPLVIPSPLRAAPAPELIATAQGVNYAPAYMPPVTAFLQQERTYLPPVVEQRTYLPPVEQRTYLPPPPPVAQVTFSAPQRVAVPPPPQQQVVYDVPQYYPQPEQVQEFYEPPQVQVYESPKAAIISEPQQVVYQAPVPPPILFQTPKRVVAPQAKIISIEKAPVQLLDSYSVAPVNTVTNPNAPVYPDAIKVVKKPVEVYGPPEFIPGEPLSSYPPAPTVVKVVQKEAVRVVQAPPQPIVQYAPQYVQPPVKYIQQAPQYVAPAPAVAPIGLYAGAIGFHTQNSAPNAYLHSYGTQGFQVTSSRQFNKAVLPYPVVQRQVVQPAPIVQQFQPQVQIQETYAPQYLPPPPVARAVVQAAPVVVQPQAPVYGPPQVNLVQSAPVAVGKKQNPLTFAYSYDQGAAKVSHSYSGSGW